ncbi:uncharacterized protein EI97DRAFT_133260 [Westerdykella ornata]|uniref:Uncharacterized protein n=1 Tax=Westerdykella ornata TaxID=318751 RepID=A0A6A6JDI0_WESOR|nr:uncharacterized protein EI97DRAFT_133260 [Westerdykella ornata]KAF2274294.1 hypothetical protein EI97DRAFT_133260 [Westerdykella ornata]
MDGRSRDSWKHQTRFTRVASDDFVPVFSEGPAWKRTNMSGVAHVRSGGPLASGQRRVLLARAKRENKVICRDVEVCSFLRAAHNKQETGASAQGFLRSSGHRCHMRRCRRKVSRWRIWDIFLYSPKPGSMTPRRIGWLGVQLIRSSRLR